MDSAEFEAWWNANPRAPSELALGTRLLSCDREACSIALSFEVGPEFANARGTVQGGFVAAMLDTCLGIPVLLASDLRFGPITLNLNVDFQGAVPPGLVFGRGVVTKLGRNVAFVSGTLHSEDGALLASGRQVASLFERKAV